MAHRAQHLILAFLGACVVDRLDHPVSTQAYIDVLGAQGVGAAAVRATLLRMVERGLLVTDKVGRGRRFALTDEARSVLRKAGVRVRAQNPFAPSGAGWTLLSYSVPESRRELRHQLRARLLWGGFGLLRDGLWIASGAVDLDEVFGHLKEREQLAVNAFECVPIPGWINPDFVQDAWDLGEVEALHRSFIRVWSEANGSGPALPTFTLLIADWLQLLRADPRLPLNMLPRDWPSDVSTEIFRRAHLLLEGRALHELSEILHSQSQTSGGRAMRSPVPQDS